MSTGLSVKPVSAQLPSPEVMSKVLEMMQASTDPFANVDVGVERKGVKLILPNKMTYEQAIKALERKIKDEETVVAIHEEIDAFPLDGAYSFMQVLKNKFGWAQAVPTPGFFGDRPPTMVTLEIGHGQTTQVIWGDFEVPGIEGRLATGATRKHGMYIFCINGKVKKRYQEEVKALADEVRAHVKLHSVYKGKALRFKTNDSGTLDFSDPPSFLDLNRVNEEELTFSDELMEHVQTSLFTPIERTEECRQYGVPLKRGILLEGPYGTGKTLTAYVTAKKAEANGWTFLHVDRVAALKEAIVFARQYGPAIIFAEDIDRSMDGERDEEVDDILNEIDGIDSKGQELIVVLTTNHVENIEKAMLRPGRLDAVISVLPPDAKAASKLVRLYARGLIPVSEKLESAGAELNGQIPAVIREVVERSKLYAIKRLKPGQQLSLSEADLVAAAKGMKRHLELMAPVKEPELTPEAAFGAAAKELLGLNGHGEMIEHVFDMTKDVANEMGLEVRG